MKINKYTYIDGYGYRNHLQEYCRFYILVAENKIEIFK